MIPDRAVVLTFDSGNWDTAQEVFVFAKDDPRSEGDRVETGGFLGDYSDLQPGRDDQAQRVFIDTAADFSRYEKVLIDPVVTWDTSAGSGDPDPALQRIADQFDAALRSELQREFELAMDPGTDTLRIRAAITGVHKSGVSVELEVLDATSGRRGTGARESRRSAASHRAKISCILLRCDSSSVWPLSSSSLSPRLRMQSHAETGAASARSRSRGRSTG